MEKDINTFEMLNREVDRRQGKKRGFLSLSLYFCRRPYKSRTGICIQQLQDRIENSSMHEQ